MTPKKRKTSAPAGGKAKRTRTATAASDSSSSNNNLTDASSSAAGQSRQRSGATTTADILRARGWLDAHSVIIDRNRRTRRETRATANEHARLLEERARRASSRLARVARQNESRRTRPTWTASGQANDAGHTATRVRSRPASAGPATAQGQPTHQAQTTPQTRRSPSAPQRGQTPGRSARSAQQVSVPRPTAPVLAAGLAQALREAQAQPISPLAVQPAQILRDSPEQSFEDAQATTGVPGTASAPATLAGPTTATQPPARQSGVPAAGNNSQLPSQVTRPSSVLGGGPPLPSSPPSFTDGPGMNSPPPGQPFFDPASPPAPIPTAPSNRPSSPPRPDRSPRWDPWSLPTTQGRRSDPRSSVRLRPQPNFRCETLERSARREQTGHGSSQTQPRSRHGLASSSGDNTQAQQISTVASSSQTARAQSPHGTSQTPADDSHLTYGSLSSGIPPRISAGAGWWVGRPQPVSPTLGARAHPHNLHGSLPFELGLPAAGLRRRPRPLRVGEGRLEPTTTPGGNEGNNGDDDGSTTNSNTDSDDENQTPGSAASSRPRSRRVRRDGDDHENNHHSHNTTGGSSNAATRAAQPTTNTVTDSSSNTCTRDRSGEPGGAPQPSSSADALTAFDEQAARLAAIENTLNAVEAGTDIPAMQYTNSIPRERREARPRLPARVAERQDISSLLHEIASSRRPGEGDEDESHEEQEGE